VAWEKASRKADYDHSAADRAVEAYQEYLARYPKGSNVAQAQNAIAKLHAEQARGLYEIARFYDKQRKPKSAMIYYNSLIARFPESKYSDVAKKRVEAATRTSAN
jgi:outer membrane protein assembly factor BamD